MLQTVNGKLAKEDLGIVMPHEHIFIDLTTFYSNKKIEGIDNAATVKVEIGNLGILDRDPYAFRDNLIIDNIKIQIDEIMRFKKAGGSTVVDATSIGIGRNPVLLKKIAMATGLNIVVGSGYYVESTHPEYIGKMEAEEIANFIERDFTLGIDNTGIKAGVIGEIGISEVFTENEKKVLRASAIAQKHTGAGILVHINPWTVSGVEAAQIVLDCGVDPQKVCICHVDVEGREEYIEELLKMGIFIEFDNFGKEYYVDKKVRRPGYGLFISDTKRVDIIRRLIAKGYLKQILLSCDVCLKTLLRTYGGWGYDHLLVNILPMMEEAGITKEQIDCMLKTNPAEFLC